MLPLVLLLLGLQAFAQTSYFTGKRTDTLGKEKLEWTMAGILSLNTTSRTWNIVRCVPHKNDSCIRFDYILLKDKDEKYYLQKPGNPGFSVKLPAKVEDDHINLRRFTCASTFGLPFKMEHLSLGKNTLWKSVFKNPQGEIIESKVILEPATKEQYDAYIKDKKIKTLELQLVK